MSTQLFCFTLCSASLAMVRQLVRNLSSFSIFLMNREIWKGAYKECLSLLIFCDLIWLWDVYLLGPAALHVVDPALPEFNCLSVAIIRPLYWRQLNSRRMRNESKRRDQLQETCVDLLRGCIFTKSSSQSWVDSISILTWSLFSSWQSY